MFSSISISSVNLLSLKLIAGDIPYHLRPRFRCRAQKHDGLCQQSVAVRNSLPICVEKKNIENTHFFSPNSVPNSTFRDRCKGSERFCFEVQISWQAQHFVNLDVQILWQAQHFVNLDVQKHFVNLDVQISWQVRHFVNRSAVPHLPRNLHFEAKPLRSLALVTKS